MYAVTVREFLGTSHDITASSSRFNSHLKSSTVNSWLQAASRCGLAEPEVQLCIANQVDYIVQHHLPVDMDMLSSLDKAHADQLLSAKQDKYSNYDSLVHQAQAWCTRLT
jgi:hypothetical protein